MTLKSEPHRQFIIYAFLLPTLNVLSVNWIAIALSEYYIGSLIISKEDLGSSCCKSCWLSPLNIINIIYYIRCQRFHPNAALGPTVIK